MTRLPQIAVLLAVATFAGVGGFLAYRWSAIPDAPLGDTARRPAVASSAASQLPDLSLPDLQGSPRNLSEWRGRPLVINFWATWCEPCRREIPLLEKLRAEYAQQGVEVLGIAIDFKDAVASYAKEARISYPLLVAEENAMVLQAFGVGGGLPTTVFAARSGRIVEIKVGELQEKAARELLERTLEAR